MLSTHCHLNLCNHIDCSLPGSSVPWEYSWQEYLSGLPFPSPEDLPNITIEPASLASLALAGRFFNTEPHGKPICSYSDFFYLEIALSDS